MTPADLVTFEREVAEAFTAKRVAGPIHLSGGNEDTLIDIFQHIPREDWVFSTYRNHYHALLHGVPREKVMAQILAGHSMNLSFPEHRFLTSAIVGGTLSIATGVAAALKRQGSTREVWCFVGDMAATTGAFMEARTYAFRQRLPLVLIIEDNGLSCDTPTQEVWGTEAPKSKAGAPCARRYKYTRLYPHAGIGKYVF